jgi:hypothetical protein
MRMPFLCWSILKTAEALLSKRSRSLSRSTAPNSFWNQSGVTGEPPACSCRISPYTNNILGPTCVPSLFQGIIQRVMPVFIQFRRFMRTSRWQEFIRTREVSPGVQAEPSESVNSLIPLPAPSAQTAFENNWDLYTSALTKCGNMANSGIRRP